MISGDLSTFPLPDLLQWADESRKRGILSVEHSGITTWMYLRDREVTRVSPPPALSSAGPTVDENELRNTALATAADRLLDLFASEHGHFELNDAEEEPEAGVPVRIAVRVLVMEGLRHLDELPRLQQAFPDEGARLSRTDTVPSRDLSPIQHRLLTCAEQGLSLGETRLRLGLSRPALLRRMNELHTLGMINVEGSDGRVDPVSRLIAQASILVREKQFEEAAIVFGGLLASDPSDQRLRRLLQEAEREQVAALYTELDPLSVVKLADTVALRNKRLSRTEREVAERINGRWDVASLVLASPLREVETLKSLRKLTRMGVASLEKREG